MQHTVRKYYKTWFLKPQNCQETEITYNVFELTFQGLFILYFSTTFQVRKTDSACFCPDTCMILLIIIYLTSWPFPLLYSIYSTFLDCCICFYRFHITFHREVSGAFDVVGMEYLDLDPLSTWQQNCICHISICFPSSGDRIGL